jgi:GT2 family glycosyltransferase
MLRGALDSLNRYPPQYPVEVIVVDNASQPPIADGDWPMTNELKLVRNLENRGYGAAANQGIALARGKYVAIANADIEFLDGTLDRLVDFLDRNPDAGVVAPQFLWSDMTPQPSARRFPRLDFVFAGRRSVVTRFFPNRRKVREFLYAGIEDSPVAVPVEVAIGAFLVAPRVVLEAVQGFDESYFMFVEDADLCRRVSQAGKGVFVLPPVRMIHHCGAARRTKAVRALGPHRRGRGRVLGLPRMFARVCGYRPALARHRTRGLAGLGPPASHTFARPAAHRGRLDAPGPRRALMR